MYTLYDNTNNIIVFKRVCLLCLCSALRSLRYIALYIYI